MDRGQNQPPGKPTGTLKRSKPFRVFSAFLVALLNVFRVVKVRGRSMYPLYRDGDFVFTSILPVLVGRIQPGDVVVFYHLAYGKLIKLVEQVDCARGEIFVVGLDEASIDSRHFGPIRIRQVTGKVIGQVRRPDRKN